MRAATTSLLAALALLVVASLARADNQPPGNDTLLPWKWLEDDPADTGKTSYSVPEELESGLQWDLPEWHAWMKLLQTMEKTEDGKYALTAGQLNEVKALEEKCRDAIVQLKTQHAKDGFAINAREAYVRFKQVNDRPRGKRKPPFSPESLGRVGEKFTDVWTYSYWRPFVVYFETKGETDCHRAYECCANMLRQLSAWFDENFVKQFGLKRTIPTPFEGAPTTSRKKELEGRKLETPGELAEAEGWPIEIVVLKDSQSFSNCLAAQGLEVVGARASYMPHLRVLVTWFDPNAQPGKDEEWAHASALIHEAFHQLSDYYAANPLDYRRVGPTWEPSEMRPRYANVLIQEGLTDSIAGFKQSGTSHLANFEFLAINQLRLKDWKTVYERFCGKKLLFRIEDMLKCTHYGKCQETGMSRWKELKLKGVPQASLMLSVFYSQACQASTFFFHFKENGEFKYRAKWLSYIKADYTGAIARSYESADAGIKAFKDAFGIKEDSEFAAINAELEKFTLELKEE